MTIKKTCREAFLVGFSNAGSSWGYFCPCSAQILKWLSYSQVIFLFFWLFFKEWVNGGKQPSPSSLHNHKVDFIVDHKIDLQQSSIKASGNNRTHFIKRRRCGHCNAKDNSEAWGYEAVERSEVNLLLLLTILFFTHPRRSKLCYSSPIFRRIPHQAFWT